MKSIVVGCSLAITLAFVCTIFGVAIYHDRSVSAPSEEDREKWRSATEQRIRYIKDRRTGFCFAVREWQEYTWGGQVPCTSEVEKLLVDSL